MCGLEVPGLEALRRELEPQGLVFAAVATPGEPAHLAVGFAQRHGWNGPVLLDDTDRNYRAWSRLLGDPPNPFPRQFLIDPGGRLVYASSRYDAAEVRRVFLEFSRRGWR